MSEFAIHSPLLASEPPLHIVEWEVMSQHRSQTSRTYKWCMGSTHSNYEHSMHCSRIDFNNNNSTTVGIVN